MSVTDEYFYFETNFEGNWQEVKNAEIFNSVLLTWKSLEWSNCYFYINPVWPSMQKIDQIPKGYDNYILIWLTEHIDIFWTKQFAETMPESKVICVIDSKIYPSEWWPPNVHLFSWITWPEILLRMIKIYGKQTCVKSPRYHITSLCNRISEFKFWVSARLARHQHRDKVLMSYHGHLDKKEDLPQPNGIPELDDLLDFYGHAPILCDTTTRKIRDSITNYDWRIAPFNDSLFCLTNEGFNYSSREHIIQPGPYMTEKTFKPFLSGQAVLPVGQFDLIGYLSELGFCFDYGLDLTYDSLPGDTDRILALFNLIDIILDSDLYALTKSCRDSTCHNSNWIIDHRFHQMVEEKNQKNLVEIFRTI